MMKNQDDKKLTAKQIADKAKNKKKELKKLAEIERQAALLKTKEFKDQKSTSHKINEDLVADKGAGLIADSSPTNDEEVIVASTENNEVDDDIDEQLTNVGPENAQGIKPLVDGPLVDGVVEESSITATVTSGGAHSRFKDYAKDPDERYQLTDGGNNLSEKTFGHEKTTGGDYLANHITAPPTLGESKTPVHTTDTKAIPTTVNLARGPIDVPHQAIISGSSSGEISEDKNVQSGVLKVDGTLSVIDEDNGQAQFSTESLQGQFGSLSINNLGHWTYTANNSQANIQGLKTGDFVTDTIIVHSLDGTEQKITVTINGTDDKAVIGGTSTATITEDKDVHSGISSQELRVDGALTVTDLDNGQAQFNTESLQGQFGTLSINNLGHWTYMADNSQPNIQGLKTGDSVTDTVIVHSLDGTEQKITVTINGTDDKALIAGTSTASLTEDKDVHSGVSSQELRVDGALTVTDLDNGQAQFNAESLQGQFGTLSINNLGHWTYTADNSQPNIQGLKTGDSVTDTVIVRSVDGTEQKVTVTINGTDDKAVIAGTSTATITEDKDVHSGSLHVDGALNVTDIDNGQAQFNAESLQGQFGTLSINHLGHWTYTADNSQPNIQGLKTGDSVTDTVIVHSVDGTEQNITVTINGTDDKAVIAGTSTASLTEDKDVHSGISSQELRVDGALNVTDIDSGQAQFNAESLQGQFGTLSINNLGHWTYTADNSQPNIQSLKTGDSVTDTVIVHSVDGTEQKVTVTINGTDDKALIAGTSTASLTEDKEVHSGVSSQELRVDGALTATDIDNGQAQFNAESLQGQFGTLSINELGHWTYTADNSQASIQGLNSGKSLQETLVVHSVDGTEQKIYITINGTNDGAVIGGQDTGVVTEESQLKTAGTLTITDTDTGEAHFSNTDIAGSLGILHLTDSGAWTYDLDNTNPAVQALNQGSTIQDILTVKSADGTTHQVTITVNGTNDVAVISGTNSGAVTEETQLTVSGQLTVTDTDTGEAHFSDTDVVGTLGTLHLQDNGNWTYDLDNTNPTVQALSLGKTATDTITVASADGTTHQVTITVNGTNDAAVISGTNSGAVTEETQLTVSGQLTVTDTDTGEAHFSDTDVVGTLGTLHLQDNGNWTYDLDNTNPAVQALGKGATATDLITVASTDGTTHQVNITVNGTDDAPILTVPDLAANEDGLSVNGQARFTDIDTTDTHSFTVSSMSKGEGAVSIDPSTGEYTFKPGKDFQALAAGETKNVSFNVTINDGHGGTDTEKVTVTVTGTNDAPTLGITNLAAIEDGSSVKGTATFTDVDLTDSHSFAVSSMSSGEGSVSIDAKTGEYTFAPGTDFQKLAAGQTKDVSFNVTVNDGHGGTDTEKVTVTVTGTDDASVIGGQDTGFVDEGHGHYFDMSPDYGKSQLTSEALYADGKLTITDPDAGQSEFDAKSGGYDYQGQYGRVNLHQDGTWHYMVDIGHSGFTSGTATTTVGTTIDQLGEGQSLTDTITVYSKDGTSHDIVVTIHGDNDKPYCSSEVQLSSGKEDTAQVLTLTQLLQNTVDVDANDAGKLTIENLHADHGSIAVNTDGTFTFTPDKDYNGQVQFTYEVKDAHGGVTHTGATTSLVAVNDNALITGVDTGNVTEDGRTYSGFLTNMLHTTGQLTITDPDAGEAGFDFRTFISSSTNPEWAPYQSQLGGQLSINSNGEWEYVVDNTKPEIQALGDGETLKDSVIIHSKGGTEHTIELTIHGTNDAPVVSAATLLPPGTEDTVITLTSAQLLTHATDVDHNDIGQLSIANLTADHGSIITNLDGTFSFTPDKDYNGQVQFNYDVKDVNGGITHTAATTSLAAVRDAAIIKGTDTGSITEDQHVGPSSAQTIAVSGSLRVTDPDAGQDHFQYSQFGEQAIHDRFSGKLTISHSGVWSYEVDNSKLQYLHEGDVEHVVYRVYSADGTSHDITITVTGTNDIPVLTAQTQSVIEDGSALQGQMQATDADYNSHPILTFAIANPVDGLTFNTDGSYTFDPTHSSYQHLGAGQDQTITIPVTVKDEVNATSTQNLTITVHGTNDAPVVSAATLLPAGTEDTVITLTSAQLLTHATDEEHNDIGQLSIANLTAEHGSIITNLDGTFSFTPDKDYNGQVQFTYDVKDAHGGVTHTGATTSLASVGDAAIITGDDKGDVSEHHNPDMSPDYAQPGMAKIWNSTLHESGTLTISDADIGEASFVTHGAGYGYHGQLGKLHITEHGFWSYVVDNTNSPSGRTIDALGAGETLTDTITVQSKDGTTHDIVITIHGDNDKPYCSSEVQLNSGKEDTTQILTLNQLLQNTVDVDANDSGKLTIENLHADHGSIAVNTDGTFTFTPDKDYNGSVNFSYDVKDTHGGVTHTGATTTLAAVTDAAQISGQDTGTLIEDNHPQGDAEHSLAFTGVISVHDTDVGESHFHANHNVHAVSDPFGGRMDIMSGGVWQYVVSNDKLQHLGAGEHEKVVYQVHSVDGTTHALTVDIVGTNDAPVVSSSVVLPSGTEDSTMLITQAQLLANATDIDSNDTGQLIVDHLVVDHGSIITNPDGTFTFTPDKDYNGQVQFTYDVKDAHGGVTHTEATTSLVAVNDNALITGIDTGNVTEDGRTYSGFLTNMLHTRGQLTITEPDAGEAGFDLRSFISSATNPEWAPYQSQLGGKLSINPNGEWEYVVDNTKPEIQALGDGETLKDSVIIHSKDGIEHTIEVTIHGTNDAPVLAAQTQSVTEDGTVLQGQMQATDVDNADTQLFSIANNIAGLTFNADGSYSFNPADAAYQYLADGQTQTLNIPITVTDHSGATSTDSLTIIITGTNDRPTVSASHFGRSDEDTTHYFSVTDFGFTDTDDGDTLHSVTVSALPDIAKGHFELDGHSVSLGTIVQASDITKLTFVPAKDYNGDVQFGFTVNDGHSDSTPKVGSFTIDPVRDGAIITEVSTGNITEDGPHHSTNAGVTKEYASGDLNVFDPDAGESAFQFSQFGETAINDPFGGHLRIDRAGNWGYTVDNVALQYLAAGQTETVVYRVESIDGTSYQLNIEVNGTNDTPTVSVVSLAHGSEDIAYHMQANQFGFRDVDTTDTLHSIAITDLPDALEGKFVLDGHDVNANQVIASGDISKLQFIPAKDFNGDVDFKYTVNDGHTNSAEATNTLHIDAVNDAPTVTENKPSLLHHVDEDASTPATGQVTLHDIDGDSLTVTIDPNHAAHFGQVSYDSNTKTWTYVLDDNNAQVDQLNTGEVLTDTFNLLVDDGHGGQVSKEITMTINGNTDAPPMPTFLTPPQITGSSGHQDLHSSLGIPPLIHQGIPTPLTGWGISTGTGHSVTTLHGQYGTLHVNPVNGDLSYNYRTDSGVQKSGTGQNGDVTDTFLLTLAGDKNSQVEVNLHLHSQSVHGNSGHHIDQTILTGMDLTPLANPAPPAPLVTQSDEPDYQSDVVDIDIDLAVDDHVAFSHEAPDVTQLSSTEYVQETISNPVDHYLDMLGINKEDSQAQDVQTDDSHVLLAFDNASMGDDVDPLLDDGSSVDPFESPLDDDKQHHDALETHDLSDEPQLDDPLINNDDDSLHQALNNMHNQF
jgi:VCBS repeat-containing protein